MMRPIPKQTEVLLVCTVGGTAQPIAKSITELTPQRIIFLPSKGQKPEGTESTIDDVLKLLRQKDYCLESGQYDIAPINNPQDFAACVREIRSFRGKVSDWQKRGENYAVFVDFTAGTKCMTAALSLVAARWDCRFVYVGGEKRSKGGVGIVENGLENVLQFANPLDAMGYQVIEDTASLFNAGNYAAAKQILEDRRDVIEEPALKQQFSTWANFCSAYLCWDQFNHDKARENIENVIKNVANIQKWLQNDNAQHIEEKLKEHKNFLFYLGKGLDKYTSLDLLSNADRRAKEGRFDDAVARLYRVIEAAAQLRLKDKGIESCCVKQEQIPKELHREWHCRFAKQDTIKLALQDDFKLLKALDDSLGKRFFENELDCKESVLGLRNASILAHGFTAIGKESCKKLWDKTISLLEILEINGNDLIEFPKIEI